MKKRDARILIIGDSFVEGVGGDESIGWAQVLENEFSNFAITISGEGGDNVDKLHNRWPSQSYDVVIIQIGTNDSRFRPSLGNHEVKLDKFENRLEALVSNCRSTNKAQKVILVGLFFVDERLTVPYKADKIYNNAGLHKFDKGIRRVAEKTNSEFVALNPLPTDFSYLSDGLHPSNSGHAFIAERVKDSINSIANSLK